MALLKLSSADKESPQPGDIYPIVFSLNKFNVFDLLVIIICLASFGCSWIESMVNYDSLHWGFFYGPALDLMRGAMPHSETFIGYGYLTTWIQSISLRMLGERLASIGIITGLFYSLSLYFSYRVFLRFLQRHVAFIALVFIFLIHPYMIYPSPNYFVYTFQLLGLIFFLKYSQNRFNGFLAGFFLSMALLSRYSSVIAILPPIVILLCWEFFTAPGNRKRIIEKIGIVLCGFIIPLAVFFTYLFVNSALADFFFQNRMMIELWGKVDNIYTYLNFLAWIFQIDKNNFAYDFRGGIFTLILVVSIFVVVREIYKKIFGTDDKSFDQPYDLMAVSVVVIFGYLNAVHHYETFRLVNGASLGVGLCALIFNDIFVKVNKTLKYLMVVLSILIFVFLSSTLFFKQTTSSYYPWKMDVLFRNGVTNNNIGIFKGKLLTKEYNDFYQEVFDSIAPFKNTCYILNYTNDGIAFLMNDLPRVQIASINYPWFEDVNKQAKIIDQNKAVILSYNKVDFSRYVLILAKRWPEEIPWLGGAYLFIYAPEKYTGNIKRLSVDNNPHG